MISMLKMLGASVLAAIVAFVGISAAAASAAIEAAKSSCVVGEQVDGYLGVADESKATEEIRREVRSINQQRKAAYERLAQRNGVTVEVTAALTAERLINQAPSGHCYRDENGAWQTK
jgi:uncharacterized protein YdbL (DUF1318 family)